MQNVAEKVSAGIKDDSLGERLQIQFFGDMRKASIQINDQVLSAKLVDLPCIVESSKTLDKKTFYKTGDVCQMLVCTQEEADSQSDSAEQLLSTKKKEAHKSNHWNHGITPPLKNVRKRRFRKTAPKKYIDSPEVEKEVQRLIKEDLAAINVSWKIVADDDGREDTQSVLSDGLSRQPSPFDDESNQNGRESELLRILAEASSESSDDDDIDVEENEDSGELEIQILKESIRMTQTKIMAQKNKLRMELNPLMKKRFESYLNELEEDLQDKKDKIRELERRLK